MTKVRRPRKTISGELVSKDSREGIIDRFLFHRHQSAYKTYRNMVEMEADPNVEEWKEGQIEYWGFVAGTINMLRQQNYPQGWRKNDNL